MPPRPFPRRTLLGAAGAAALLLSGCARPAPDPRLTIAGGVPTGIYIRMAQTLADVWTERLGLTVPPVVLRSAGSVANMDLLIAGRAQLAISQVDVAADTYDGLPRDAPASPRALARLYDDVTHVVVRRDAPFRRLADLRGAAVSVGPDDSGYSTIARRLLDTAGIGLAGLGRRLELGLEDAAAALASGAADAFFWSGGVPTNGIVALSQQLPIRLLDLGDVLSRIRASSDVYTISTVPATTYRMPAPVSTLSVRNVLLATNAMPDEEARLLVEAAFAEQPRLAEASPAAVTIDTRTAIGTQPIPLHPGAVAFYQARKDDADS